MDGSHVLIVGLLIVLIIVIACQGSMWMQQSQGGSNSGGGNGGYGGGNGGGGCRSGFQNPWTNNHKLHAVVQGSPDGPKILRSHRNLIPAMARTSASATPEQLHKAERAAWFKARDQSQRSGFDTERMMDTSDLTMQEHDSSPAINWQDALVDLVADKRVRENQAKWEAEMQPFNTTWLKVDDMDEASVFGLGGPGNAQGLYTFSRGGVNVDNPMFLTDVGPDEFSQMKSAFRFNG